MSARTFTKARLLRRPSALALGATMPPVAPTQGLEDMSRRLLDPRRRPRQVDRDADVHGDYVQPWSGR